MNGVNYLADTNCFIYMLDEHPMLEQFAASKWTFSYITEMELLSKKGITKEQDSIIRQMLATCSRAVHTQEITELTIKLRRKYSLKLPDAIIAATAKSLDIPILTADKGFSLITEVDMLILEL
ncbi:MAG: PIN domain-containing protein [Taibaiella sp.]|nr:PIN domain-containing protein [Taibaiella sp.]